jgi:hypothetical protein
MADVPVDKGGVKTKPISIFEYNMFMKGVDRTRTLNSYPTQASCGPLWATFG